MKKKKILIFIDWYLPGYKAGGPIQSVANLVEYFKEEFEFSIITRDTDYCENLPYPNIKSNEWNTLANGVKVYYFSKDQLTRSAIRELINKTEFNTVYLNGIYSLYFTLFPLFYLHKKHAKHIVIAARGMFAESALAVKKTKKNVFLFGIKVLKMFDDVVFHATTENEKNEIQKVLGRGIKVRVAENLPQSATVENVPDRIKSNGSLKLVNVARIAPEKNLLFALQVLKEVKFNVEFDFYGPIYNQEYWKECENVINKLPSNIKVSYKGSIESAKVLDVLKSYHFMFMPTRGENFGHIILQSLMLGCPVIISDQTPWKQLYQKNIGWDISLENTDKFVEIIGFCAQLDQTDYNAMSIGAFRYAQHYIKNPEIKERNRALFL